PTTNLEALACGTPVVTFATGGSPEALDENTGIVVEQGNTEALTQAVCRIAEASSQGLPRYSTEACRNRALLFRQQDQFQKYIELYRTIAGQL
ncbi:MAG: glycosyltransferase, partial [Lachnospiraceae bacterium]